MQQVAPALAAALAICAALAGSAQAVSINEFTAGINQIRFYGHLKGRKRLRPGRYTVTITAAAAGDHSTRHTLRFTVLGSRRR